MVELDEVATPGEVELEELGTSELDGTETHWSS